MRKHERSIANRHRRPESGPVADRDDRGELQYKKTPWDPKAGNVIAGPGWAKVRARYLQTYRNVCGWHEKIGFDEMVAHRFLTDDRLIQETRFSSGRAVVVNFSDSARRDPRGVLIQPNGYHTFRR